MPGKNEVVAKAQQDANIVVNNAFIDSLAKQLKEKEQFGLSFPADYNPSNALTGAYLILQETKGRDGKPVLETCTKPSIARTLMDMVTQGLNMQKKQCYPIAYGKELTCQVSYHGWKAMAHRYGAISIDAEVIYDGDVFEYTIEDGRKKILNHQQDFRNIDNDKVIGAYCYIKLKDGSTYVEIMNISQIKTAWRKGFGYKENSGTHKDFTDMMAKKTVTSRACRQIVNQYGDSFVTEVAEMTEEYDKTEAIAADVACDVEHHANAVEFEEPIEVVEADVEEPDFA